MHAMRTRADSALVWRVLEGVISNITHHVISAVPLAYFSDMLLNERPKEMVDGKIRLIQAENVFISSSVMTVPFSSLQNGTDQNFVETAWP
mmetsp:Transcript_25444/g.63839  ORF Transcript_25444/g.63839 Transcript_25444/m.63839 type:complete len:91 (+) Transcript_25444:83-355(+)